MPADDVRFESRVILFFDIHSFSSVFTALGSDVYAFIQQVYEDLGELVVSTGGEIIKYAGDSMFALFPEGSEPRVVDCALRMRRAYTDLAGAHGLSSTVTELEVGIASGGGRLRPRVAAPERRLWGQSQRSRRAHAPPRGRHNARRVRETSRRRTDPPAAGSSGQMARRSSRELGNRELSLTPIAHRLCSPAKLTSLHPQRTSPMF